MKALDRFLQYIQMDTASDETYESCPSTEKQRALAELLRRELIDMGVTDARVDEHGYLYASLPANRDNQPAIGLIAHMDTVSFLPCQPMNARVVQKYDGGDIALKSGDVIRASEYEALAAFRGHDLVVTDGNTILGADDKAGVAEIMTCVEKLIADPSIPHGKVCVAFTPDEEIGRGADLFDVPGFGADFAYTVDGGALAEVEYENFNAASAKITVRGRAIHPGSAKNKMVNAQLIAMEYNALLPAAETPSHTEGYEGFYHLTSINGTEEKSTLSYIIRDHDRTKFEARKALAVSCADFLNAKYGAGTVEIEVKDSYYNMKDALRDHMDVIDRAFGAIREIGYEPKSVPIRGGTDGAHLSFMGLPCPNLSTGAINAHGRHELLSVQQMDDCVEMLLGIVRAR